ncbi:hypothetical protein G6O69_17440 [Pseudenhygromyxa sp. WMMC2535]|uniref:hypothetical protein n=1 Tax=Pseudenhygromyxa sp. WMMC2535 TaxID=2712867 RepID=UPI001556597C|nr:hypothetical protein [Pseudenhygromyxa sp. WMMC2535]NVB39630.1 hypothetical protein [Pseudenhygromyxa sp. WMMC2535]
MSSLNIAMLVALSLSSVVELTVESGGETSTGEVENEVAAVTRGLEDALKQAMVDSKRAIPVLLAALEACIAVSEPLDENALETRLLAQLSLARAYQNLGDDDEAEAAADEAVRMALGGTIPADKLGERLERLIGERRAVLEAKGSGTLRVQCEVRCEVYVDERRVFGAVPLLVEGSYRVRVVAKDGHRPPLEQEVDLEAAGDVVAIDFERVGPPPDVSLEESAPRRAAPRWSELTMISTGVGLSLIGGVVLGFDGVCPEPCESRLVFDNIESGWALFGIGGGLWLSGVIMLVVDEVRTKRRGGKERARKRDAGSDLAWLGGVRF